MAKERENFIDFIEEKDNLFREENNYLSVVWEKLLTSNYWKNWREKTRTCLSEEVNFFTDRVLELRSRILWTIRSYRKDKWSDDYTRKLVEINERELENITEKEFYGNKPKNGVRRLTVEEISGMFEEFNSWTRQQLISEINRLKSENEVLKNNQTLTSSEKQDKLKQNQQKLDQIQSIFNFKDTQQPTNSNFPTGLLISGAVLLVIGLISFLVIKNKKNQK